MVDLKVLVVCGYKNTGKTTLTCKLVESFNQQGYKIGTIKHDGHEFDADIKNTDSTRHYNAGARQSAVFSNGRFMMIEDKHMSLEDIFEFYKDNDLVIVEGCKGSTYPKIEVLRKGYSEIPVSNKENRIAIYSDFNIQEDNVFLNEDYDLLVLHIKNYFNM